MATSAIPDLKWLLILDNVDDPHILNTLWSNLHGGSVLITSREPISGLSALADNTKSSRVTILSLEEGPELVRKRLRGHFHNPLDDNAAADLAKRFAYYPLYIDQMTSFMESTPLTVAELYQQLSLKPTDHELQEITVDSPWYGNSVAKAIESHITKLRFFDSQAANFLTVIAFFDPDSIPEPLLVPSRGQLAFASSTFQLNKIIFMLRRSSFIYFDEEIIGQTRRIHLHRLVRDAALRVAPTLQESFHTAVQILRKVFPLHQLSRDHMVESWAECEIYQAHVLALHRRYLEFKNDGALNPSFEFIELIYSCAW